MNPQGPQTADEEMRAEYDFSRGVRGKHHQSYREGTNVVFIDSDLVREFPDSEAVNQALRLLVRLARSKGVVGARPNEPPQSKKRTARKAKASKRSRAARVSRKGQ